MARIVELEKGIFVAPQLTEADFDGLRALGFRAVVANRPDGEAEGQLPRRAAEAAAWRNGLEFRFHPVAGIDVTEDAAVTTFARLMHALEGPVLFYCGSGTRATLLWAQASVGRLGIDRVVEIAARAGVDLAHHIDILEARIDSEAACPFVLIGRDSGSEPFQAAGPATRALAPAV